MFFGCYFLTPTSTQYQYRRYYIGYTVNPVRRLRQHNGQLACGGAKRTKKFRPWQMILIVSKFPTSYHALQFEYLWQHLRHKKGLQRDIKAAVAQTSVRSGTFSIEMWSALYYGMYLAMKEDPWKRYGLELRFQNKQDCDTFLAIDRQFCREMQQNTNTVLVVADIQCVVKDQLDGLENKLNHVGKCCICDTTDWIVGCVRKDCNAAFHLTCFAKWNLHLGDEDHMLLPTCTICPRCKQKVYLHELRNSVNDQHNVEEMMEKEDRSSDDFVEYTENYGI